MITPQHIQGSKTVAELERQTNIALERIKGQIGTGQGGAGPATIAALQAQIDQLKNLSGGFADIGGTGAGSPPPNPSDGTVATDGVTITGDGVNFPIALIEPFTFAVRAASVSPDTVVASDQFILASASAGADIIENLPASVGPDANGRSRVLVFKKMDANAHNVVITRAGADTIDGATTVTITLQYDAVRLVDGALGAWSVW